MDNHAAAVAAVEYDDVNWKPLEARLPLLLCGRFMWMNAVEFEDGTRVDLYKHKDTRRHHCLDEAGLPYGSDELGDYGRIRHGCAIEHVFSASWALRVAEPEEVEALKTSLAEWEGRDEEDWKAGLSLDPVTSWHPRLPPPRDWS